MRAIFEHHHQVRDDEIDVQGHANNVCYVRWMQDAAVAHSTALGWTAEAYRRLGFGWVARSHAIEYRQPARAGDRLVIETWVALRTRVRSIRRYRILRPADAAVLATAETHWIFVNYATGQPARVPAEIARAFEAIAHPATAHRKTTNDSEGDSPIFVGRKSGQSPGSP